MEINQYINEIFNNFVIPGALGGLLIGFSIYFISLGVSFGYKLISSFANYGEYEEIE